MKLPPNPHHRHRFPAEIISYAVWLYHVFSLSLRDVELLLVERGVVASYETVRRWCKKFAANFADRLRLSRDPGGRCQSLAPGDLRPSRSMIGAARLLSAPSCP